MNHTKPFAHCSFFEHPGNELIIKQFRPELPAIGDVVYLINQMGVTESWQVMGVDGCNVYVKRDRTYAERA